MSGKNHMMINFARFRENQDLSRETISKGQFYVPISITLPMDCKERQFILRGRYLSRTLLGIALLYTMYCLPTYCGGCISESSRFIKRAWNRGKVR